MDSILIIIPALVIIAVLVAVLRDKASPRAIVGATVAVLLVAVALIPAIDLLNDDTDDGGVHFDDYIRTDAVSASGSLELLQIGGETYAHAKTLGSGELDHPDGTVTTYTVTPADLDVFLFIGQSNIAYWTGKYIDGQYAEHAIPSEVDPSPALGRTYYYGTDALPYTPENDTLSDQGIHDMVDTTSGDLKIGSLDAPFAAGYAQKTGHKCLVVNCGWSGKSITSFTKGGAAYNHAKDGYNDAMSKIGDGFDVSVKGYVFCQGEADPTMPVEEYTAKFTEMHEAITTGSFTTIHPTACYIDLVREYWARNAYTAQLAIAGDLPNVQISSTISSTFSMGAGTMMPDNLHYTQIGQNLVAEQLVENI